jgi:hypothetical protein
MGALIHRSAWNRNSANFAFWAFKEFCEVGIAPVLAKLGQDRGCAEIHADPPSMAGPASAGPLIANAIKVKRFATARRSCSDG